MPRQRAVQSVYQPWRVPGHVELGAVLALAEQEGGRGHAAPRAAESGNAGMPSGRLPQIVPHRRVPARLIQAFSQWCLTPPLTRSRSRMPRIRRRVLVGGWQCRQRGRRASGS